MKRTLITLTILAAALVQAYAQAQSIKPGLWELNNQVKTGNAQTDQAMAMALKQLANMPPEQRAQMEAMMGKNGISMPKAGSNGGITLTACVTPEMAAKKELPLNQKGKCNSQNTPITGGMNVSFTCSEPKSSGQGTIRFNGDSNYTMNMNVTSEAGGKPQNLTVESTGHWLGASCPGQ